MNLPTSRVVVIGPGRVGTALAVALGRAGHRVVAAGGGSDASRQRFGAHVAGARLAEDPAEVVGRGDLIVVTTPDDVIENVVTDLAVADAFREGQYVVHLSGARGLAPLRRARLAGCHVAACHPAQTVPAGTASPDVFVGAAWAVTASDLDRPWARDLVEQVGGDPHDVRDEDRVLYHAGLVLGSNAVGAAVAAARHLLLAARVDDPAAFLAPLVAASVRNVLASGSDALTGPVVRGDLGTIQSHLDALAADLPTHEDVYRLLSRVVLALARPGVDDDIAARLDALLDQGGRR